VEGLCCLKCEEKIIDAIRKVHGECFVVSAHNFYVSTDQLLLNTQPLKLDGFKFSQRKRIEDPGILDLDLVLFSMLEVQ
jgi:copper chaperone CopZ